MSSCTPSRASSFRQFGRAATGRVLLGVVAVSTMAAGGAARAVAEEGGEPLWEVGVIGFGAWLPDYPAAGQNHVRWLVLPRAVYRGPILQLGEESLVRGLVVDTERIELDVSLAGSFPADSDDNRAREGMPDLDWLGEIGPRLSLGLLGDRKRSGLSLDLQARGAFSTDLSNFDYRGLIFHPELVWREAELRSGGPELELRAGPIFADERFMDYFYEVPARFVTPERRRFDASAGYLGSFFRAYLEQPLLAGLRLGLDLSLGVHTAATNEDSPLSRNELTVGVGTSLIWSFWESETRVE
jgi:outer membrane protein